MSAARCLAHEVGHIMSGHPTYTTLAIILLTIGLANIPYRGSRSSPSSSRCSSGIAKSEFSADRAALLGTQDVRKTQSVHLKLAGGAVLDDPIDLDAFLVQAKEYETMAGPWDKVWQFINTVFRTHPFATVRAGELQRWIDSGEYAKILAGDYIRRGQEPPPLSDDLKQAGGYYSDKAREAVNTVSDVMSRAGDAFRQAWRGGASGGGGGRAGVPTPRNEGAARGRRGARARARVAPLPGRSIGLDHRRPGQPRHRGARGVRAAPGERRRRTIEARAREARAVHGRRTRSAARRRHRRPFSRPEACRSSVPRGPRRRSRRPRRSRNRS